MKTKGNGGYQIIDFEGQAPNTLDVDFFENTIARGKPLWVNNLVVNGETYSGVGSLKKTLTNIIVAIASINIVIALSDGSTTYEASGETIIFDGLTALADYLELNDLNQITTLVTENQTDEITEAGLISVSGGSLQFKGGTTITSFDYLDSGIYYIAYNTKLKLIVIVGGHSN